MILSTFGLIFFSLIFYKIFLKNREIRWQFKCADFIIGIISRYYFKIGTKNFNRARFIRADNFVSPKLLDTNGSFKSGVLISDVLVQSQWKEDPYENKNIPIKIFVPEISNSKNFKKLPILVNIHGGGYVLEFNDDKSLFLSKENMIIISVKYRLAPEHKYPAALEDCYSVFDYISKKENSILNKFADYEKIGVIGDSAGANLSASMPFLIKERNLPIKLNLQILIYPNMFIKGETESRKKLKGKEYFLSPDLLDWFEESYLGINKYSDNINDNTFIDLYEERFVSPLKQKDFNGIPPALIILATQDIIYTDGNLYSKLLSKNNVKNEVKEIESVHAFYTIRGLSEEKEANECIFEYLRKNKFLV